MVGLLLVGTSQQQQSLQAMRPLHERQECIAARLAEARRDGLCAGAMMLATCNRFEVVFDLAEASTQALRDAVFADIDVAMQELRDEDVIDHLIRVAAGLQSLVLGEDQILGQVGQGFRESEAHGLLGKRLHMVYSRVMRTARKLRSNRPVVSAPRSVAELAARLCREAGPRIAIIGAGTTAHVAAESLQALDVKQLFFANRTVAHARRLAHHFGGKASSIDELVLTPPDVDGVIVAINGRTLHLPAERMPSLQTVVDISQPAVIVGLVGHSDICHLDLDGLAQLQQQREERMDTWVRQVTAFAREDAHRIWRELSSDRVDLGQLLDLHVENAAAEVDRALRSHLRSLDKSQAEAVRKLAERVARRNAHLHLSDVKHYSRA